MKKTITYISFLGILAGTAFGLFLFKEAFYYELESFEKAVIFEFGEVNPEPVQTAGIHFRMPWPIHEVVILNTQQDRKVVIGYTLDDADSLKNSDSKIKEHLVLTSDANLVTLKAEINYTIIDPILYSTSMENPDEAIKDASESTLKSVIGLHEITEVLTGKRAAIAQEILTKLQKLANEYEVGIKIQRVQFLRVLNPFAVREAFEGVESAKQDSAIAVEKSLGYQNLKLPKARGQAFSNIKAAEAWATARIAKAEGETAQFNALLQEYKSSKKITKKRLYLETMEKVLPGIRKVIIDDKNQNLNLLNLGGIK